MFPSLLLSGLPLESTFSKNTWHSCSYIVLNGATSHLLSFFFSNTCQYLKQSYRTGVIVFLLRGEIPSVSPLLQRRWPAKEDVYPWYSTSRSFGMHGMVGTVSVWWVLAKPVAVRGPDPVFQWRALSWRWRMIDDLSLGRCCGAAGPSSWPHSHGHRFVTDAPLSR